jgi:hypothetical protein
MSLGNDSNAICRHKAGPSPACCAKPADRVPPMECAIFNRNVVESTEARIEHQPRRGPRQNLMRMSLRTTTIPSSPNAERSG